MFSEHLLGTVSKQERNGHPFRRKNVNFLKSCPTQSSSFHKDYFYLIQRMGCNYFTGNVQRKLQLETPHSEKEGYIKDAKNRIVVLTFFFY